jgi:NTP pyrophosphatase (non-canonical NTP hydrolase)
MDKWQQIENELSAFVAEREWQRFHDPKNLTMAVASEAGELSEILRWVPNDEADGFAEQPANRARIAAEVADISIFLHLLCNRIGIDLPAAILDKIEINRANHPVEETRGHARRARPRDEE